MALANDSVLVTPGTGATIATHTVGGKEHQVVMLADPAGHLIDSIDTWYAYADNIAFAANKHFLSIVNAAGSGKVVKVRKFFLINLAVAAVTGVMVRFNFMRASAHSAGTAITCQPADSANAALPSQVTARTGATVTEGALLFAHATSNDEVGATSAFPTPQLLAGLNWLPEGRNIQELTLREGEGFSCKMVTNTTVGTYGALAVFTVE